MPSASARPCLLSMRARSVEKIRSMKHYYRWIRARSIAKKTDLVDLLNSEEAIPRVDVGFAATRYSSLSNMGVSTTPSVTKGDRHLQLADVVQHVHVLFYVHEVY